MNANILQDRTFAKISMALLANVSAAAILTVSTAATAAPSGDAANNEGDIVVTARKRAESLTSVPVAIYALGEKDLARYAVTDMISAGKLTPGLVLSRSTNNSGANIYLRGVGSSFTSASFDQAVGINIDNVPISKGRAIFQSYFDMQQIEVLRGPQALFFGKNSTAGVISIHTADPGSTPEFMARAGYEFNGRQYYGEAMASGPVSDALGIRLAVRGSSMNGGFFTNIGETLNGVARNSHSPQEDEYGGRLTIVYKPVGAFDLNIKLAGSSQNNDGVNGYTQLVNCQGPGDTPQPIFGVPNVADGCKLDRKTSEVALAPALAAHFPGSNGGRPFSKYTGYLGAATANYHLENITLTSVTGYYDFKTSNFGNFDLGSASQVYGNERMKYSSFTQELRIASSFHGPLNFTAGLFFDDTSLQFRRAVRLFTAPADPVTGRTDQFDAGGRTHGNTYSAFTELTFDITPTVDISGGARFSREVKHTTLQTFFASASTGLQFVLTPIKDRFADNNVSPQVTLRWRPDTNTTFFVSYKKGYKSGGSNLSEIPFAGTTASTIHFESEEAKGLEAGIKGHLLDRALSFGLTVYRNIFTNLQVSIFDPAATTLHVGNAGRYRTQGIELDTAYQVPGIDDLSLRGSVYYNQARYRHYIGPCYTGQTVAQGCNLLFNAATGAYTSQDYKGRPGGHAPDWTVSFGSSYEFPIAADGLKIGLSADARYTSSFYLGETLSPFQRQRGYVDLNATIRLFDPVRGWELALIGRNLTDRLVGANAIDNTGTGFGTGTNVGRSSDTYLITGHPREITLQATYRF